MLIRLIVLSLVLAWDVLGSALVTLPITRTFHDADGRPLYGQLLKVKEDQVYLQRDLDGARFWVPRNTLSQDDQDWLLTQFPEHSGQDAFEKLEWPDRAEPSEPVKIEVVEETYKDNRFIYASEHFQYESPGRLTRSLVREFAEVFEATFAAVMAMPLPFKELPPDEPMRV